MALLPMKYRKSSLPSRLYWLVASGAVLQALLSVRVVAVCPGYVHTDLHQRAGLGHLTKSVPSWMWLESDAVIAATERALRRGKVVVVPGFVYRLVQPFLTSRLAQRVWRNMTRRR